MGTTFYLRLTQTTKKIDFDAPGFEDGQTTYLRETTESYYFYQTCQAHVAKGLQALCLSRFPAFFATDPCRFDYEREFEVIDSATLGDKDVYQADLVIASLRRLSTFQKDACVVFEDPFKVPDPAAFFGLCCKWARRLGEGSGQNAQSEGLPWRQMRRREDFAELMPKDALLLVSDWQKIPFRVAAAVAQNDSDAAGHIAQDIVLAHQLMVMCAAEWRLERKVVNYCDFWALESLINADLLVPDEWPPHDAPKGESPAVTRQRGQVNASAAYAEAVDLCGQLQSIYSSHALDRDATKDGGACAQGMLPNGMPPRQFLADVLKTCQHGPTWGEAYEALPDSMCNRIKKVTPPGLEYLDTLGELGRLYASLHDLGVYLSSQDRNGVCFRESTNGPLVDASLLDKEGKAVQAWRALYDRFWDTLDDYNGQNTAEAIYASARWFPQFLSAILHQMENVRSWLRWHNKSVVSDHLGAICARIEEERKRFEEELEKPVSDMDEFFEACYPSRLIESVSSLGEELDRIRAIHEGGAGEIPAVAEKALVGVVQGGPSSKPRVCKKEATILARNWLPKHPDAKARDLSNATGISLGMVPSLTPWQAHLGRRKMRQSSCGRKKPSAVGQKAWEGLERQTERENELREMIRQQGTDDSAEKRGRIRYEDSTGGHGEPKVRGEE